MNKDKIKSLIKQTVNEELLRESLPDLESLHSGISTSSEIGRPWFKMISSLESVISEVQDFRSQYSPNIHGPTPNVLAALNNLQQVVKLLSDIKPVILGMDDIERRDV